MGISDLFRWDDRTSVHVTGASDKMKRRLARRRNKILAMIKALRLRNEVAIKHLKSGTSLTSRDRSYRTTKAPPW
jgi:hypothetical protein